MTSPSQVGFQPRTTPGERRADLDLRRKIAAINVNLDDYYTRSEADALFLTESEADALFLTQSEADTRYVNTAGDTMTGLLTLNANQEVRATAAMAQSVISGYVDGVRIGYLLWHQTAGMRSVAEGSQNVDLLAGSPASGLRVSGSDGYVSLLKGNPTSTNHAANKGYVDLLGMVQHLSVTSNVGIPTTQANLSSFAVSFTAVAGRRYKVRAKLSGQSTVANDVIRFVLTVDDVQTDLAQFAVPTANAFYGPIFLEKNYPSGISAGSHAVRVQGVRQLGSGSCQVVAQAGIPCFIEVTDEGPA